MKQKSRRNKTIDFSLEDINPHIIDRVLNGDRFEANQLSSELNQTINGDTFETMPKLPRQFIDLALIDPPYNLTKKYDNLTFKEMSVEDYQNYTQKWIDLLRPLLKEKATLYLFSDWKTSMALAPVLEKNFYIQNRITWQREKGRGAKSNWKNGLEDIWFLTTSKEYTFNVDAVKLRRKVIAPYKENGRAKDWEETVTGNFRDTSPSNFWDDISIPYWSMPENTAHPTQKPEKLLAKLILASSNEGDVVFDPFSGSGSSLVTAKKLNRQFLGIEQSLIYCAWGEYRLELAEHDKTIQGYTDNVFWERNTLAEQQKINNRKVKKNDSKSYSIKESIRLF